MAHKKDIFLVVTTINLTNDFHLAARWSLVDPRTWQSFHVCQDTSNHLFT